MRTSRGVEGELQLRDLMGRPRVSIPCVVRVMCYAGAAAGQGGAAGGAHSDIVTLYLILRIKIAQELRKDKEERQEARQAGGGGGKGRWPSLSEEHRQKIRASNTGKVKGPQSEDHRRCALGAAARDVFL